MVHIARYIEGNKPEYFLSRTVGDIQVSFHSFQDLQDLLTLAQRFTLGLVFIGTEQTGNDSVLKILELARQIKDHTYLAILPTILYYPEPINNTLVAAYENGIEEMFSEAIPINVARAKTMMIIKRAIRDLSVNPSSRLPGPVIIEKEIERQIELGQEFAVCYADLDNFKAFNDYYGYYYGDRVVRLTSRIIKDIVFDLCREGFVGHIGGDDFIFIIPSDLVTNICENILKTFDAMIPFRYADEDRVRGSIVSNNRRGEKETFQIMTLSIAVVINKSKEFKHVGELSHMLADLKKYTKSLDGSNFVIERRHKY